MKSLVLARTFLGQTVTVQIDRPQGSRHPEHGFLYPVNYGYVPGTLAPDGEELDAYVLCIEDPLDQFCGHCIAIVHRLDDDDDKLVIVPDGFELSDEQILDLTHFQEQYYDSQVIRAQGPPLTNASRIYTIFTAQRPNPLTRTSPVWYLFE